jgi:hypothetical protein
MGGSVETLQAQNPRAQDDKFCLGRCTARRRGGGRKVSRLGGVSYTGERGMAGTRSFRA